MAPGSPGGTGAPLSHPTRPDLGKDRVVRSERAGQKLLQGPPGRTLAEAAPRTQTPAPGLPPARRAGPSGPGAKPPAPAKPPQRFLPRPRSSTWAEGPPAGLLGVGRRSPNSGPGRPGTPAPSHHPSSRPALTVPSRRPGPHPRPASEPTRRRPAAGAAAAGGTAAASDRLRQLVRARRAVTCAEAAPAAVGGARGEQPPAGRPAGGGGARGCGGVQPGGGPDGGGRPRPCFPIPGERARGASASLALSSTVDSPEPGLDQGFMNE